MKEKIRQWFHMEGPTQGRVDDDWELYEEAAVLREREAQIEREVDLGEKVANEDEDESSISIVSFPTYGI